MLVSDILRNKGNMVVSIGPESDIAEAVNLLSEHRIGAVLVMDGSRVLGILSERDIVRSLGRGAATTLADSVVEVMTRAIVSCGPGESIDGVMATMTERRIRHLPVIDGGRLVGLVSIGDVVKGLIEEARHEAEDLKRYIAAG